ncbi:hypothetical protein FB45DRAFT_940752 [Roridomyces roridus]|uniref:Uncharacterized protein n=1 Tax=Roridomyces roridus TaxID=1738132 RepID=A0AAD7B6W3_9AGAR|nr:hypothetical protein FB45DRAFT_940752 [Roridomyces roridus]
MAPRMRPPSTVQYEPLRASVFDAFAQLGAFDDDSGIVELIFPDLHVEKESQRARVKLPEEVQQREPSPPPETPRKSRFTFGLRSRSKSRTRGKKEKPERVDVTPTRKPKKTRSSPDLHEDARESEEAPRTPTISSPKKQSAVTPGATPEHQKPKRLTIFPRRAAGASLDQPRPSISEEEWQQITMTGSIADYQEANPFLGTDPNATVSEIKPARLSRFSKFTSGFSRSTPTSPRIESMPTMPGKADESSATDDPTTPTGETTPTGRRTPTAPVVEVDPTTRHPNGSTTTLPAPTPHVEEEEEEPEPEPFDPDSQTDTAEGGEEDSADAKVEAKVMEVDDDERLETTSQMDHARHSLSGISEAATSETVTTSVRESQIIEEVERDPSN